MPHESTEELARLHRVEACTTFLALRVYVERDVVFILIKSVGPQRRDTTVNTLSAELLLNFRRFFETRAGRGGDCTIDRANHLHRLSFNESIVPL